MKMKNVNERYLRYSAFSSFEKNIYYSSIYAFVKYLNIEYPGFNKWYAGLFEKNRELKNDREIIVCQRDYNIAGVAILKSTTAEKKICTLRVARRYQRQGIGRRLMELSFEWLENDKPLFTMHSTKQREFSPLLNYYGFVLEQKKWNYYNLFSTELAYNGILPEKRIPVKLNKIEFLEKKIIICEWLIIDLEMFYRWVLKTDVYAPRGFIG